MKDGIIELDSTFARKLNFTSDRFDAASYLFKRGREIWVSMIISLTPRRGHFRALTQAILAHGYSVVVPTPLGRMRDILARNGYEYKPVFADDIGEMVETWQLDPEVKP